MTTHPASDQADVPAISVHAGDELVFAVVARLSGTTACSAIDALSARNFVIFTLAGPAGERGHITIDAEHAVRRQHANTGLLAA